MEKSYVWPQVVDGLNSKFSTIRRSWPWTRRYRPSFFDLGHDKRFEDKHNPVVDDAHFQSRRRNSTRHTLIRVATILLYLPWYLLPRQGRPVRAKAFHELHPLSYLDALRGYLAMIIFTGHTMRRHWRWIPDPILAVPWLQFPFRGGFTALNVFFWISGYSITYRILGFVHTKKYDKVLDALASSMFRRYFRLFLPALPVTLFTVLASRVSLVILPKEKANLIQDNPVWWWMKDSGRMLNPFNHVNGWWNGQNGSELLDPFWSLDAEFRSSIMMFALCTATCKMSSRKRSWLILVCIPPLMAWQAQWAAMAFLGMWFAEQRQYRVQRERAQSLLGQTRHVHEETAALTSATDNPTIIASDKKHELPHHLANHSTHRSSTRFKSYTSRPLTRLHHLNQSLLILLFSYSFVFLQNPFEIHTSTTFPHNLINAITPSYWHFQMKTHLHLCIGSILMLYPLDRLPILQRPLMTPFSQFLGELSFGIYAVHWPVKWIVWEERYLVWKAGRWGNEFDRFTVLAPGYVGMALCVIWAAEGFRRLDWRVVKFCKDLEGWMFDA